VEHLLSSDAVDGKIRRFSVPTVNVVGEQRGRRREDHRARNERGEHPRGADDADNPRSNVRIDYLNSDRSMSRLLRPGTLTICVYAHFMQRKRTSWPNPTGRSPQEWYGFGLMHEDIPTEDEVKSVSILECFNRRNL
jgi:hypothetical protein